MSYVKRQIVDVTTAADGTATAYTESITGMIASIQYVKDGSNAYTDGVDFTITTEDTAQNVWVESNVNASKKVVPHHGTHGTDGTSGSATENIHIARERLKIVLAQGGNAKTGRFHVTTV